MSRRGWGIVLLVGCSEVLGLLAGQWFFGLFDKTVPPAVITSFNRAAAHGVFLGYGALLGLGMAAWCLLAVVVAPMFRPRAKAPSKS